MLPITPRSAKIVRKTGIEPIPQRSKGRILPLYYILVAESGFAPLSFGYEPSELLLLYSAIIITTTPCIQYLGTNPLRVYRNCGSILSPQTSEQGIFAFKLLLQLLSFRLVGLFVITNLCEG